ncbi:MAG: PTPDL family protein [Verrucomicrobiota bacterium]
MKVISSPLLVFTGILLAASVATMADTATLKSGEILNGKILSETDQEIVMDVAISPRIIDEKKLAKSDVQSVARTPADETAYQALNEHQIGTHSLKLAAYPPLLKDLDAFLKTYPESARAADVKKTLEALKQEQARVKAGELKWDNRWYTPKEAQKNKYQLGAQMRLSVMRDQAANRDFIGALNTFEQIEKLYPGSAAFPDAAELAQSMVRIAAMDMVTIQNKAKVQETLFNNGIVLVPEPQKSQMIALRKAQSAAAEASLAAAEKAGVKWKPLFLLSAKSFEALKATLATETPRIEKFSIADMRNSLTATKAAEEELKANHLANAEAELNEAQSLWPQNAQIAVLAAEWKALKAKPTPTPTPAEAAPAVKEKKNSAPHASPKA